MWSVVLKILSILGIILLILLGIVLVAVLSVLFLPVVYRGSGSVREGKYRVSFRFRWFFGLVRGEYTYPEGGALRIKALWLTLFDSSVKQGDGEAAAEGKEASGGNAKAEAPTQDNAGNVKAEEPAQDDAGNVKAEELAQDNTGNAKAEEPVQDNAGNAKMAEPAQDNAGNKETAEPPSQDVATKTADTSEPEQPSKEPLTAKWAALKEKVQPYLAIVRDGDNRALVRHVLGHLGRLLKSIRPRILRLEALIGLGEPDVTGYVYGACWAVKPFLGRKCSITITPDFDRRVLEGDVFLRGHIMGVALLYHAIKVLLDKRLGRLLDQLKTIKK